MPYTKHRSTELTRRSFIGTAAAGAGALALGACNGMVDGMSDPDGGVGGRDSGPRADGAPGNGAPVWTSIPPITFVAGVASDFSIMPYVSDPDGDALALALNDVALPAGVTFDAAGMRFVYDGSGPIAMTTGHVLSADDGRG
jgi:hypothetical protein